MATRVRSFTSVASMCEFATTQCGDAVANGYYSGEREIMDKYGARSTAEAAAYILNGATEQEQAEARKLIDKIDGGIHGRNRSEWTASVSGAYPMVPDFLAGVPDNMRRRVAVESDVSPLRLYVDLGVSGGLSRAAMSKRGAAVAALAMALGQTRPVELYAFTTGKFDSRDTDITVVRMDTTPMSLSHIVAVFSSPQFSRAVDFAIGYRSAGHPNDKKHGMIGWGWSLDPQHPDYLANCRKAMGLEPQDIIIPGGHLDSEGDMMRDPVAWVETYLAAQRNVEGA